MKNTNLFSVRRDALARVSNCYLAIRCLLSEYTVVPKYRFEVADHDATAF